MLSYTELISGKWYRYDTLIFKYRCLRDEFLYDYGFHILCEYDRMYYHNDIVALVEICELSGSDFLEVDIKDFYQYLPDDNIDKIVYCRRNKIDKLLNG